MLFQTQEKGRKSFYIPPARRLVSTHSAQLLDEGCIDGAIEVVGEGEASRHTRQVALQFSSASLNLLHL